MKKILCFLLLATVALVGCNRTDETNSGSSKHADGTFTLTVGTNNSLQTRAGEITVLPSVPGYLTRYTLEIYHEDKNGVKTLFARESKLADATNSNSANVFNFRLITNQKYDFLVWVDYSVDGTDLHYKTNNADGLRNVSLMGDILNNDKSRDAFFGKSSITAGSTASNISMTCVRPFGQLNVKTTDWEHVKDKASLEPTKVRMDISGYNAFNLMSGDVAGTAPVLISYAANQQIIGSVSNSEKDLTCDYIFGQKNGGTIDALLTFYNNAGSLITNSAEMLTSLPIKQNFKTNVTGNLLTKQGIVNVVVDADWEDELNIVVNLDKLQDVLNTLNASSPEYVHISVVGEGDSAPNSGSGSTAYYTFQLPVAIGASDVNLEHLHITFTEGIKVRHEVGMRYANPAIPYCGKLTLESAVNAGGNIAFSFPEADVVLAGNWYWVGPRNTQRITIAKNSSVEWINCQTGGTKTPTWLFHCYGVINRASMSLNTSETPWKLDIYQHTGATVNNSRQNDAQGVIEIITVE